MQVNFPVSEYYAVGQSPGVSAESLTPTISREERAESRLMELCCMAGTRAYELEGSGYGYDPSADEEMQNLQAAGALTLACLIEGTTPEEAWGRIGQVRYLLRRATSNASSDERIGREVLAVRFLEDLAFKYKGLGPEKVEWPRKQPSVRGIRAFQIPTSQELLEQVRDGCLPTLQLD